MKSLAPYGPCHADDTTTLPRRTVPMPTRIIGNIEVAVGMWDLTLVKQHAVKKGVFTAVEVDDAEREYKRFVVLSFLGSPPPIGKPVDDMWHVHILFTQDYDGFCHATGGKFLHHRPGILDEHHGNRPELNFDGYRRFWGEPDKKWWDGSQPCSGDKCGGDVPKDERRR